MKPFLPVFLVLLFFLVLALSINKKAIIKNQVDNQQNGTLRETEKETLQKIVILKDVGEPYMTHFGLSESDFTEIHNAGFDVIESNFDICASDEDISYLLKQAERNNLSVIMPAGSGEAEWGYECDQNYPEDQKPVWQKEKVKNFVNKWKDNPSIYAWDISNEAGSVFPNASKQYYLSLDQLQQSYKDVKSFDPQRPIMIRINGWFFYDHESDFFRFGNPFSKNVADIVMVNAYSNVEDYYDDFVDTVTKRAFDSIKTIDPNVEIIVSLGLWEEKPLWHRPTFSQLQNDLDALNNYQISGVAFFKYGAKGSEWYLPQENDLWQSVQDLIATITLPLP